MKKRISLTMICLLMIGATLAATISVSAAPPTFNDVPDNHPYKSAIDFCFTHKFINGTGDGNFQPEAELTRGQLALIWGRTFHLRKPDLNGIPMPQGEYDNAVYVLYAMNWVNGTGDREYSPDMKLTREQIAAITARTYLPRADGGDDYKKFMDSDQIADWARNGVSICIEQNLFKNLYTGEMLEPKKNVTRGELCQMLYNLMEKVHSIDIPTFTGGKVTADKTEAAMGETVTLTVTADPGKRLKEGSLMYNNKPVEGMSFTMPNQAVTISAVFEDETTTSAELKSIEITKQPDKVNYTVGESLSLAGLEVTATFADDTTKIVTDYTTDPEEGTALDTIGPMTVTVRYTSGTIEKTTDFSVTIEGAIG